MVRKLSLKPEENIPVVDMRSLYHVSNWIFDLDKTLYPAGSDLFPQIEQRMCSFISTMCNLEREDAWNLQKKCYHEHGTTLKGLIVRGELEKNGLVPDDFLRYVHDIDYSCLKPNKALDEALAEIPGKKFVFTNGTGGHAERVLEALGIRKHFKAIFDIRASKYLSKPDLEAYRYMLDTLKIDPEKSAFFEDSYENLPVAAGMGMVTIWIKEKENRTPLKDANPRHCHYVTDDLTYWLKQLVKVYKKTV